MKLKRNLMTLTLFCFSLGHAVQVSGAVPAAGNGNGAENITTIILVRHAEKVKDDSKDPLLTPAGKARAQELAYILKYVDLEAVYSTPFIRTQETALPTAQGHGLEVRLYPGKKEKDFLQNVLTAHAGKTVLIVGHSNTVNVMANILLGEDRFADLADPIYDNLFIAAMDAHGKAAVTRLRFGAHTPEKR